MKENRDFQIDGDALAQQSKKAEQKPQIEIVKRDEELESFLANIRKYEEDEEELEENSYFERKEPQFIDVDDISKSFTYGKRSDFKRSDSIDWEEVSRQSRRDEIKESLTVEVDNQKIEKSIEFLERKFSKRDEPAPVYDDLDDEEAKKREKFRQIKRELKESLMGIASGYKTSDRVKNKSIQSDDEISAEEKPPKKVSGLGDKKIASKKSVATPKKSVASLKKPVETAKKTAVKKKSSETSDKASSPRVKGVRKSRSRTAGMDLPKTGRIIYIDVADIKPVSWQDVVVRKGRFAYHMTPTHSGGWFIKRAGNEGPSAYVADRDEAVELAKKYAKKEKSTLKIHNSRGTIVESYSFGHTTKK